MKGYSLGMRQRLGLAAALLGDPEVLVLDEPANGLDPQGIRWLRDFLRTLAAEGRTILVSSHVLAEVAQTVDDVVIIHRGRLVRQATIAEVEAMAARATLVRSPDAPRLVSLLSGKASRRPPPVRTESRPTLRRNGLARSPRPTGSSSTTHGRARLARGGLPRARRRAGRAGRMMRLYAAELLKLKTLRGPWGFLVVAIGLAALFTAGSIGGSTEAARLEERYQFRLVLDMAFPTGILSLLLGIILFTTSSVTARSRGRCSPSRDAGGSSSRSSSRERRRARCWSSWRSARRCCWR